MWSYTSTLQYAFMAWCSAKAQGHRYVYFTLDNENKRQNLNYSRCNEIHETNGGMHIGHWNGLQRNKGTKERRNEYMLKEVKVEPVSGRISKYKNNWLQHVKRIQRQTLVSPPPPKYFQQIANHRGQRSEGRPLKRLVESLRSEWVSSDLKP
jgi:hypothetical protein